MRSVCLTLSLVVVAALGVSSQEPRVPPKQNAPTFSATLAPILYSKCVTCHRPGESRQWR
jgi:hypothetical protein